MVDYWERIEFLVEELGAMAVGLAVMMVVVDGGSVSVFSSSCCLGSLGVG